jgi:hypothetical protein
MKIFFLRLFAIAAAGSVFLIATLAFRPAVRLPSGLKTATVANAFPLAPTGGKILLQGPAGSVWVNNFYKSAAAAIPEDNAVLLVGTRDYDIIYYRDSGEFEISFGLSATVDLEERAENSLLEILGIGRAELCKLEVSASRLTPGGDIERSPLSFCQSVFKGR